MSTPLPAAIQGLVEALRVLTDAVDRGYSSRVLAAALARCRAALAAWESRGRLRDDRELVRAIADAVLADLEDRRDVKRPLRALRWGDDTDQRIYREIRTAIGTLALDAIEAALLGERGP